MSATLEFLGAVGTVTGSKFLLDTAGHRTLLDCGLYQGATELRQRNWEPLPVAVASIHDVVLTLDSRRSGSRAARPSLGEFTPCRAG